MFSIASRTAGLNGLKFFEGTLEHRQSKIGNLIFKGSDRLCKLVELSMLCCGQILKDSFKTYKSFPRSIITEFKSIFDVQNHERKIICIT